MPKATRRGREAYAGRRERSVDQIVSEVAWGQAAAESTITIHVTLTTKQLVALCNHVDRILEEDRTNMDRDELDAIQAMRDARPYRWEENRKL
jgi:hypothetical protein